jgi:predicted PurR-regulated permease PerM
MRDVPRPVEVAIGACALVLVLGALSLAHSVFAPVAFALFTMALVWPVHHRLQKHLPRIVALAVSLLATAVVVVAFGSLIAWGFGRVVRSLVNDAARLQLLYEQMSEWLESHGIVLAGLWADYFNVTWLIRMLQGISGGVNSTLTFVLIVLTYVMIGLLEVDDVLRRLGADRRPFAKMLLVGSARTAAKLRRYMHVRTQMSVITGVLVSAFAALSGLALSIEWGVIAFALNYIPFVGPFIATFFPTLYAIAQFESWQMAVVVFACLNLIQFIVGSYLEPRISGSALSMSPSVVLFAVFFWTYLWGIAGTFIGVPIVITIMTICELHPSSRWVADVLGTTAPRPDDAPDATESVS